MSSRALLFLLANLSILRAEDFSDPIVVDTSGMGKPRILDDKAGVPPLLISRTLGLHSGYFPLPGNMSFSTGVSTSLTNDVSDIVAFGFDRLDQAFKPDTFLSRFVLSNVYYYTTLPIHFINDLTRYHWATASRIAAAGLQPEFWDLGVDGEKSIYHGHSIWALWSAPLRSWKNDSVGRALSLKRYSPVVIASNDKLFSSTVAAQHYDDSKLKERETLAKAKYTDAQPSVSEAEHEQLTQTVFRPEWDIVRLSAGYNDQSDRARELQHKSYWEEAHYMDAAHYLRARWFVPVVGLMTTLQKDARNHRPTAQDPNLLLLEHAYKYQAIELSTSKIALLSTLSIICSASFYKTFRHSNWDYYTLGTQFYRAYEWRGVRLPDVVPYLNSSGMSYHVTTGYRFSPTLAIPVCVEFQIAGATAVEGSVGIMKRFPEWLNLDIQANILVGQGGMGSSVKASISPWGSVAVEAGFTYSNSNTLEGRRHILSFKKGETDYELFAKVSLIY